MTGANTARQIQDSPESAGYRFAPALWTVAHGLTMLGRAALFGVALLLSADRLLAQRVARGDSALAVVWSEAAPGVWKAVLGTPESVSLLGTAGGRPVVGRLATMPTASFPIARDEISAARTDRRIVVRLPLGPAEKLYGLGLNFTGLQQRGTVKRLHVDHFGGTDNGRTHAPVPFYVSTAGYGVLIDAARYITVYAGSAVRRDSRHPPAVRDRNLDRRWSAQPTSDAVEVLIPADGATLYVFAGPTALDAVRRYNLYSGGGVLPPKWGLGFLHRVRSLSTAIDAEREVAEFADRHFPLDVLGLEPGWQSASYPGTFVWDRTRFPDPDAFMRGMRRAGVRVNLWMNPYVAPTSPMFAALEPLAGSHTVWTGIVPDVTLPEARRVLLGHLDRELLSRGVSGYKIDEVDGFDNWLWPDHATFPSGLDGEQMRQVYGLAWQRATFDAFHARDQRTFGLVRGSNAGAAPLPYVLYNDSYSHQQFITALASSGFIGVLWTPEVRSSKTGEEWLRRMQSVCFAPLAMLNAWSDGTKPWSFAEVANPVREVMQLRVRLLPYLYTVFARYHFDGTPPVRAMALEPSFRMDAQRDVSDQFMLGDAMLVAPMFAGVRTRAVALPAGRWYDFYTGAYAGAGEVITIAPRLDQIPLFVRHGATIPLLAGTWLHVPTANEHSDLELRHYGGAAGTDSLYDDDGSTFAYERGEYSWTPLVVSLDAAGRLRGETPTPPTGKPYSYRTSTWRMMGNERRAR
ncbi:glycoside hydrolase family 31 protein [soil metagenome]